MLTLLLLVYCLNCVVSIPTTARTTSRAATSSAKAPVSTTLQTVDFPGVWTQNIIPPNYVKIINYQGKCVAAPNLDVCTNDWMANTAWWYFRWQIRPYNNSATEYIIVNLYSANCLGVNTLANTPTLTTVACANPIPVASTILFNLIPNNDAGHTWSLVSVLRGASITTSGNQVIWSPSSPGNTLQQFRLVQVASPAGRLALWTPPIQFPLIAIAAANVDDGRILFWSSSQVDNHFTGQLQTYTAFYDPAANTVSETLVSTLQADMFCPGTAKWFDGSVFVVGGVTSGVTNAFNQTADAWARAAPLRIPRGYNAAVTLSNGGVFTLGGSWSGGYGNKEGEVWSPATRAWRLLPQVPPLPFLTEDAAGIFRQDHHMWLFAASNGWVFHAGPSKAMHWVSTAGNGSVIWAGNRSDDGHAMNGNAALYDAVRGRILACGGAPSYSDGTPTNNAYVIDISAGPGGNVTARRTGSMNVSRAFHTSVVLPNGEVVVIGGQSVSTMPFYDRNAVMWAELWSPVTEVFTVLSWGTNTTTMVTPRTYHSVGLLLADGRVFSSGGGACGTLCVGNHLDAQIITPPYLVNPDGTLAARPRLSGAPSAACLGATMQVAASGAAAFALVRHASTTHTVNTDQRRIPLNATAAAAAAATNSSAANATSPAANATMAAGAWVAYALAVPADPGVAVPGYYFLFALGPTGTPSVSATVLLSAC